jgi:glyoxylase-like metal-dependent hydrolase (beta-lactamase superfamily II)
MREISTGLWHWTARHEHIGFDVSSYYLLPERVLIDPMTPAEGHEWFESEGAPEHVLLTNRHHDRHSWAFHDEFGCAVHCVRNGLHELEGRGPVEPFDFGEELPGGVVAYEVDAICPDETALYIPSRRALACADGVVQWPGGDGLAFVPDQLMDNPEQTKAGLRNSYTRLLDLDFDALLLAHGEPLVERGKDALRAFVESPR